MCFVFGVEMVGGGKVFNVDASLGIVPFSRETCAFLIRYITDPVCQCQRCTYNLTMCASLILSTLRYSAGGWCAMAAPIPSGRRFSNAKHFFAIKLLRTYIFDALAYSWLSLSRTPPPNDRATQTHSHGTFPGALTSNGYTQFYFVFSHFLFCVFFIFPFFFFFALVMDLRCAMCERATFP